MSESIVTDAVMAGLENAAKKASPGPSHALSDSRTLAQHKLNTWFIENCYPQYVLELISRVRAAEAEVAGHRNLLKAECLRLSAGDVVVVTLAQPHLLLNEQWQHYRAGLLSTLPAGVNSIIISEGVSMAVLTDEQLAEAGLKRADQPWTDDNGAAVASSLRNASIKAIVSSDTCELKLTFRSFQELHQARMDIIKAKSGGFVPTEDYRELEAICENLQTELFNERQKSAALAAEVDAANERNGELLDKLEQSTNSVLAGRIAQLERDVSDKNDRIAQMISRRGDIEAALLEMATGKLELPGKQDCRVLALRLGTPKKDWSEIVKNHQFSLPADKE